MSLTRQSVRDPGASVQTCARSPRALPPRMSPARRGLPTPWSKEALGQGCIPTATERGCSQINCKCAGGPQSWLCCSSQGKPSRLSSCPDRTNLSPSSSWTLRREDRGQGKPPAPIAGDAHRDNKIPDLKRLKSRQDLCPTVKPHACLSHGDKNKSPLKIE